MSTLSEVLERKGGSVVTVSCDSTVRDAIQKMSNANIGAVVAVENDKAIGIFTERDYLRKIALEGRSSTDTAISEVMSSPLITATPEESSRDAMGTMTERRCRHLVIMDEEEMVGIVSQGDLVKHLLLQKEAEVEQLSGYIAGNY
ncbi:MAG: CBS domain-containing protein [Xanthomonadales bacterium]|nr:CBS domain-containing protein [Gammaproteobacteria bacterium]MBT8051319.1 CBS domain-containing protein [Gammaproteobacteria bacterium]MBT8057334.1 CBS domain-containing protein [Gammaproteobacteria bacterium]NNJ77779.1 CBS domain-containing protein [Xanthomonadales bacterium]NNL04682.1 CBS domain-containing protein [Xanthomonadales bacterium]